MFRTHRIAGLLAGLAAATLAAPALADNIDFGQFGTESASIFTGPLRGTTADGVGFTLVAPGTMRRLDAGSFWSGGAFRPTTPLLYTFSPGQFVLYFDHALTSLNSIAAEPNLRGDFTATLNAYLGGSLVATSSQSATSPFDLVGLVVAGSFDSVGLFTTHDAEGFAIGGTTPPAPPLGVPEPASWALLVAGFTLTGAALRRRTLRVVAA